jgi:hypothetical protein
VRFLLGSATLGFLNRLEAILAQLGQRIWSQNILVSTEEGLTLVGQEVDPAKIQSAVLDQVLNFQS